MMVMIMVVMMYIGEEWNLYWFCSLICILRKKSWYVIAGLFFVLPIHPTSTTALKNSIQFCPKKDVLL